jgi:hypothetical protein
LVASNTRLRQHSTRVLVDLLTEHIRDGTKLDRRYWHFSFLGPLINEYRPELDVDAYRKVVYRLLSDHDVNAVFSIELQALTNYPQKKRGRSFLLNAHAVVWHDDPGFDADAAADAMASRDALRSEFGAKTVSVTARPNTAEVPYLGYYLTKLPALGKRLRKNPQHKGLKELYPVLEVRDDLRLRLLEILSRLEITDLVWGVLDGKAIRGKWKAAIVNWNRKQCRPGGALDRDFDVEELWQRVRTRPGNGSRNYRPPIYYGPRPRRLPSEPRPRQGGKRIRPNRYDVWFELPGDDDSSGPHINADLDVETELNKTGGVNSLNDLDDHPVGGGGAMDRLKRRVETRKRRQQ